MQPRWRLSSLKQSGPPTFEAHAKSLVETWPHLYSDSPEKVRKSFREYAEYCRKFFGSFTVGDIVEAEILETRSVLLLTRKWEGTAKRKDHSDLELWLRTNVGIRRRYFSTKVYSFGTLVIPPGGIEEAMGERVGHQRMSHKKGEPKVFFDCRHSPKKMTLFGIDRHNFTPEDDSFAFFEAVD
jgi:hypothetical protein